jgi:MFS family permease
MSPAYNSLISKAVPQKLRGTAFGLFGTSLGLVSLPAPWVGAQLWERFSPRLPFYVTGLAALGSAIPAWLKFKLPKNDGVKPIDDGEVKGPIKIPSTENIETIEKTSK